MKNCLRKKAMTFWQTVYAAVCYCAHYVRRLEHSFACVHVSAFLFVRKCMYVRQRVPFEFGEENVIWHI